MPWVNNWQAFIGLFRRLSYTSMIDSMKDLHWDIRPSPRFGTVEVRVMDTPLTVSRGEYRRVYPDHRLLAADGAAV